jgi:hypothetical protein
MNKYKIIVYGVLKEVSGLSLKDAVKLKRELKKDEGQDYRIIMKQEEPISHSEEQLDKMVNRRLSQSKHNTKGKQ